jgi:hypothetical protein
MKLKENTDWTDFILGELSNPKKLNSLLIGSGTIIG